MPIRRVLAACAIACFSGAVALTPAEVRSRIDAGAPPPEARSASPPALPAAVSPDGDPFVARASDGDPVTSAPGPAAALGLADLPHLGPLPPNAGAAVAPFGRTPRAGTVVRAIVLGPHPTALIEDGSGTRTCAPGDALDGSRVTGVDAAGVRLADGRRLTLLAAAAGTP